MPKVSRSEDAPKSPWPFLPMEKPAESFEVSDSSSHAMNGSRNQDSRRFGRWTLFDRHGGREFGPYSEPAWDSI